MRLFACVAWLLAVASCGEHVTTIGATRGTWELVSTPIHFRHFRTAHAVGDDVWVAAVLKQEDVSEEDAGVVLDALADDTGLVTDSAPPATETSISFDTGGAPDAAFPDAFAFAPPSPLPDEAGFDDPPDSGKKFGPKELTHGALMRLHNGTWSAFAAPFVPTAIWATGGDDVWLANSNSIVRGTPQNGSFVSFPLPRFADLRTVFAFDPSAPMFAGVALLSMRDGRFVAEDMSTDFDRVLGIWGVDPSDVWAVTESGSIGHRVNGKWSWLEEIVRVALRGVWGSSQNDIWVVGDGGTILHFDGAHWSRYPSNTTSNLASVWGSDARDVWIVGQSGLVLSWNGHSLLRVPVATTDDLRVVTGTGPRNAWILGDSVMMRLQR